MSADTSSSSSSTKRLLCPKCRRISETGIGECSKCGVTMVPARNLGGLFGEDAPEEKAAPEKIGPYEIIEEIGRGGWGTVWKARDPNLDRTVAIKVFRGDRDEIRRFEREAKIVAGLNHPNIVDVHEFAEDRGAHYIVMEYVEGTTLDKAGLPERALIEMIRDAARAVDFAHERDIVHRDLKPANIMVDLGGRCRILDFGLARSKQHSRLSFSGQIFGTPDFMSPEQTRGDQSGPPTDIYSLGATLYACLFEKPPFRGATVVETMGRIREEEARVPRAVDRDLEAIVLKCLAKKTEERYATAGEVADDLERFLDEKLVKARPPSTLRRVRRFVWKKKYAVAVAVAAVLVTWGIILLIRAHNEKIQMLEEVGELWAGMIVAKHTLHSTGYEPGDALHYIGREARKVKHFIKRYPDRPQGYFIRAYGMLYGNEPVSAERDLREAIERDPDFRPAFILLARIQMERYLTAVYEGYGNINERIEEAKPHLREARGTMDRANRLKKVARQAEYGLARTYEDEVTENLIVAMWMYYGEEKHKDAYAFLEAAHKERRTAEYASMLGTWAEKYPDQMRWQEEAKRKMPHYAKAYLDLGVIYSRRNRHDLAIEEYTQAIKINPRYISAIFNRGNSYSRTNQTDKAIADFSAVIRLDDSFRKAWNNRALAWMSKGDQVKAVADADELIRVDPKNPESYYTRALIHKKFKDWGLAVEDYRRGLEMKPDDSRTLVYLGSAHVAAGEPGQALETYERALKVDKACYDALYGRALLLRKDRDTMRQAGQDMTRALQLAPKNWIHRSYAEKVLRHIRKTVDDF